MSPYQNIAEITASTIRSQYAYIFNTVVEIYKFYHVGAKVSARFEDVKTIVEEMYKEETLSTYLYESLKEIFEKYPILRPDNLKKSYLNDSKKTQETLNRLEELVLTIQADISLELHDIIEEDKELYLRRYFDGL